MSLLIGKAIYSILSGDTYLHAILSGLTSDKIYPIFAPDETLNPFIVYVRKNVEPTYTKDGLNYDQCYVTINIISDTYSECISISQLVRNALEWKVGTYGGITIYQTILTNATEDFGVDGFITSLEFTFKCR